MEFVELKRKYSLAALIEILLFVSVMPISINQLSEVLGEPRKDINKALKELEKLYTESRGLRLQWQGKKVQLTTAPELSQIIESILEIETTTTLSRASLETLAIIAYKQPVTRPMIEEIRGVNSDGVVRNLLSKGLIEEAGRAEGVGRPIFYRTTSEFLSHFGLASIKELPPFEVLSDSSTAEPKILKD
jgi:segregation and condensation protein B